MLGEKPPLDDTSVTHSICSECQKKYFPDKEKPIAPESIAFEKRFEYELKRHGFTANPGSNPERFDRLTEKQYEDKIAMEEASKMAKPRTEVECHYSERAAGKESPIFKQLWETVGAAKVCPKCGSSLILRYYPDKGEFRWVHEPMASLPPEGEPEESGGITKFLPQSPLEGPPLPRIFELKWPWKE